MLPRAFKETMAPPTGPVFLSIPWDFLIREIGGDHVPESPGFRRGSPAIARRWQSAAKMLSRAKNPVIVAGDAVGYGGAVGELAQLAELHRRTRCYLARFQQSRQLPQRRRPLARGVARGARTATQGLFEAHDVAFLCGFGSRSQLAVFKYSDSPLIPTSVRQI